MVGRRRRREDIKLALIDAVLANEQIWLHREQIILAGNPSRVICKLKRANTPSGRLRLVNFIGDESGGLIDVMPLGFQEALNLVEENL